jgi:thimet oligopeptidase
VLGGRQRWLGFSGVATEWDFVEAPSQMLEEWAWDPATLGLFARHVETDQPIPVALVERMRRANEFGKGVHTRHQVFYAQLSLALHTADPETLDITRTLIELQKRYSPFPYVDGTHFFASFGHLNGYSAMYYTYLWSLVIAKDLLGEFQRRGLLDDATARRYRDAVLVPGGSKDAADLVQDFLGRPYGFEAFQEWLERA